MSLYRLVDDSRLRIRFFISAPDAPSCRVGNTVLLDGVRRVIDGRGQPDDLQQFRQIGGMMKACSRCGLGQTSWRPVVTSLAMSFVFEYWMRVIFPVGMFGIGF